MESLNTQPISVTYNGSVADLISGAALSGLVGAAVPSPKVRVTGFTTNLPGGSFSHTVTLYKGASGGSVPGTEVFTADAPGQFNVDLDVILEAGEYLTAAATKSGGSSTTATIFLSAEITF